MDGIWMSETLIAVWKTHLSRVCVQLGRRYEVKEELSVFWLIYLMLLPDLKKIEAPSDIQHRCKVRKVAKSTFSKQPADQGFKTMYKKKSKRL